MNREISVELHARSIFEHLITWKNDNQIFQLKWGIRTCTDAFKNNFFNSDVDIRHVKYTKYKMKLRYEDVFIHDL
jgi:hypothetical protein